jgi:hypothetical protein
MTSAEDDPAADAAGGRCDQLVKDLERLMHDYVLSTMPADPTGERATKPLAELLIAYGTWLARLVPKRPRQVHMSMELLNSQKALEHRSVLDAIIRKIEQGDDLTPHLSRGIAIAYHSGADAVGTSRNDEIATC